MSKQKFFEKLIAEKEILVIDELPKLILELNRIGINLNQLTKKVNSEEKLGVFKKIDLNKELKTNSDALKSILSILKDIFNINWRWNKGGIKIAILKAINSKSTGKGSSKGLEDYLNKEKALKTGIDCNCDNWSSDFRLTKAVFDNLDGRQYKHFTQAFEKESGLSQEEVHKAGIDLVKMCKQFEGFQAVVITHNDKEHLHNHIVINSVNSETGKKFRMSNSELKTLKKNMNKYLKQEFDLEPTKAKDGIVKTQDTKTHQAIKRALESDYESFTLNLAKDIKRSLDESPTQEELKENLKKKDIKMDISESHNTVMFVDKNKKKVSSKKLNQIFGVEFDKKSLEKNLANNLKIKELSKDTGLEKLKQEAQEKELLLEKLREQEKIIAEQKRVAKEQAKAKAKKLQEKYINSLLEKSKRKSKDKDLGMEL